MSTLSQGQTLRLRAKSRAASGKVGYINPDELLDYRQVAAAAQSVRLFVAPAPCKVVAVSEVHTTAGAGASTIDLRKHLAAHTAAPDAALATTNITTVAQAAADGTANVGRTGTLTAANTSLATGDKLMLVIPATVAGILVQVWVQWTR